MGTQPTRGRQAGGTQPPASGMHRITERTFRRGEAKEIRRFAQAFGSRTGLRGGQLPDFVLAVNEAAACAVARWPGTARVRLWSALARVYCEVRADALVKCDNRRDDGADRGLLPGGRHGEEDALRRQVLRRVCDYFCVVVRAGRHAGPAHHDGQARGQGPVWSGRDATASLTLGYTPTSRSRPTRFEHPQHRGRGDREPERRLGGRGPPRGPHQGRHAGRVEKGRRGHVHHQAARSGVKRGEQRVAQPVGVGEIDLAGRRDNGGPAGPRRGKTLFGHDSYRHFTHRGGRAASPDPEAMAAQGMGYRRQHYVGPAARRQATSPGKSLLEAPNSCARRFSHATRVVDGPEERRTLDKPPRR